jgi:ADP-ribose pyrophosphatase
VKPFHSCALRRAAPRGEGPLVSRGLSSLRSTAVPDATPTPKLPSPPIVQATIVRESTANAPATGGFVNLRRLEVALTFPDGTGSDSFRFDVATRKAIDAVVVVAHLIRGGVRHVYLRSCARPALMLNETGARDGNLWELAAGLVEPGETPRQAGARELGEELGFVVEESQLEPLGAFTYPAPGFIAEQHHYFHVEVDDRARQKPSEDGSPLERHAAVIDLPLKDLLAHVRAGNIPDAKTEIALRRLAELFP